MDVFSQHETWYWMAGVAIIAFFLGRMSAGGASPEAREARRMRERQSAEDAFANLAPTTQQELDGLIAEGKIIDAIKKVREATGLSLKESKDAIDYRRSTLVG
ncbi:MAG: hypothetical protein AB7P23_02155 [Amphiplicatus sp.]